MDELTKELLEANERLRLAREAERKASVEVVQAINDVNKVQEKINERMVEMQENAPEGTDWANYPKTPAKWRLSR